MSTHRRERASSFIQEEITLLLNNAVRDPRVQNLVVTGVDLTPDRRIARVYVACYSSEEDLQQGLAGLESAKGFLKRELSQVLHWRFTPEIEFRVDRSWQQGAKVDAILKALETHQEPAKEDDDQDTA